MALKDEIKEARKDLKENGTIKQKIAYFFDYYTIHTIVIVAILIFTISFIYHQVTKPDIVLSGLVLNVRNFEQEGDPVKDMGNEFMEYLNMDTKEYECALNSALSINMEDSEQQSDYQKFTATQAIMAQCTAGAVDFISSPLNAILEYGYGDLVVNLEDVLTQEDLALYEPYFLYVDRTVAKQKAEAFDNNMNANDIPCPDPTKPEDMEDPIPVFIDVTKCDKMANIYSYSEDTLAVAIAVNAPNPERISEFLAYLFEE